jgi:ketosteroid isomerase-like protein
MIPRSLWTISCCVILLSTAMPTRATAPDAIEHEIKRLEQAFNDSYAANDLPKYFGYYAEDSVLIFYNKRTSLAEYRTFWTKSIKTEPIVSVKLSDMVLRVMPSTDVAIASYQIDVGTRHADGKVSDEHAFETDVWLNRGGAWKLAHVHYSTQAPQ